MTLFDGCWAKIERAKQHRDELASLERSMRQDRGLWPTLGVRYEPKTSEGVLYVSRMPDLRAEFRRASVIFGDGIHNLRSALDHLAFDLSAWNMGGTVPDPEIPMFPVTDQPTGQRSWATTDSHRLQFVHDNHRAVIERLQAYHRMDENHSVGLYFHPLQMLRDFDNADKHRLLTVIMIPDSGMEAPVGSSAGAIFMTGKMAQSMKGGAIPATRVELGAEVARATLVKNVNFCEMDVAAHVLPNVTLEDGRSAVAVLDKIGANVIRVVQKFQLLA